MILLQVFHQLSDHTVSTMNSIFAKDLLPFDLHVLQLVAVLVTVLGIAYLANGVGESSFLHYDYISS